MTEAEWNNSTEPLEMLEALRAIYGRATYRRLRLFACACCRRIWHLLADERSRQAVEVAERHADGRADAQELAEAARAAEAVAEEPPEEAPRGERAHSYASWAARGAAGDRVLDAGLVLLAASRAAVCNADPEAEDVAQCDLFRCIFGPLAFRPLPPVAPAVLAWNGGTVGGLAAAVYEERDFSQGRLGVLADAAEEAGLDDAELLAHLRAAGPHARGCWGVDLLLGRT